HLLVREPRPDFRIAPSQENPNIPRGGTAILQVNATRIDEFDGPIDIMVDGLPPGITAKPSRIERGAYSASLLLMADESAAPFTPPTWTVTGRSGELRHTVDPGGPSAGFLTVTPEPNLKIGFRP